MDIMGKRSLIQSLTLSEEVRKPAKQIKYNVSVGLVCFVPPEFISMTKLERKCDCEWHIR